jgi:nicotinamidase-related amidase
MATQVDPLPPTPGGWEPFALLLIDVQRDFWSAQAAQDFPHFPARVAALLAFCREQGIQVVHLRASFRPDRSDWMPVYRLLGRIPCVQGSGGEEPTPFALSLPGETVLLKQAFDGFLAPELCPTLRREGKRFLLTAGLLTSVCVLFTTISATQQGFLAAVVDDCCADEPEAHRQALERYAFAFERTRLAEIAGRRSAWLAALQGLEGEQWLIRNV